MILFIIDWKVDKMVKKQIILTLEKLQPENIQQYFLLKNPKLIIEHNRAATTIIFIVD